MNTKYALEFADGTIHTFNPKLQSVTDVSGLTADASSALTRDGDSWDSPRYKVTFHWTSGRISSVDYDTGVPFGPQGQIIKTEVTYGDATNPNLITAFNKTYAGNAISDFNYALTGNMIAAGRGVMIMRTGPMVTNVANTEVTITVTPPAGDSSVESGTYVQDKYTFNSDGLLTKDERTLAPDPNPLTVVSYTYYTGSVRGDNGSAPWGRVKLVTPGSGPWTGYLYFDGTNGLPNTGWVREILTPFMNGNFSQSRPAQNDERRFTYDPVTGSPGQGQDSMALFDRPRTETDYVKGTFVGGTMSSYAGTSVATRQMPSAAAVWGDGLFEAVTSRTAYNSSTVRSMGTTTSVSPFFDAFARQTTYTSSQIYSGMTLSSSVDTLSSFGGVASSLSQAIGSVEVKDTGTPDAFGMSTSDTLSGGAHPGATYDRSVTWFGPVSVTESDGSTTKYTYTPTGQVATKVIYSGTLHSIKYTWTYDAAGNAAAVMMTAVSSNGADLGLPPLTNTYAYDALGRLTEEIDNYNADPNHADPTSNRKTEYSYDDEIGVSSSVYITYPDNTGEIVSRNSDGSLDSDQGAAVTSSFGNEGVITTAGVDARGASDPIVTLGSTWTSITANGSLNTTTTYRNTLGQTYLVQQTKPGSASQTVQPVADAVTSFDGNGRPIKYVDFDGTTTYTSYDPITEQLASQFVDMNGDTFYTPGVDRKSNTKVSSVMPTAGAVASAESVDLANTGNTDEVDAGQLNDSGTNVGSDLTQTVNGLKTETKTPPGVNGGWTSTTTNPDGTHIVATYADGLLVDERATSTSAVITTESSYVYDSLRRVYSMTDFRGTTYYTYFEDGTLKTVQEPGHQPVTVNTIDQRNDSSTQTQRSSSGSDVINTPKNSQGQTSAQTGAGILPANFTYDTTNTGQLTKLTTYQSAGISGGTITGTGASTQWGYDPATGLLTSKTFADNSKYQYQYNGKFQLANVIEPGITGSSFVYDNAGQLVSKTLTDSITGKVSMQIGHQDSTGKWVTGYDEMGRAKAITDTDNGHSYTTVFTTDGLQRPVKTLFGSAGNASVNYDYAATTGFASTESPGALKTMTLKAADQSTVLSSTSYTYETDAKRLKTIVVNGVTFTFNYFSGSNQIQSVIALPSSGGSGITTSYLRDTADPARIVRVSTGAINLFQDQIDSGGFNQQDQILGRGITSKDVNDDGTLANIATTHSGYTYNSGLGDALTGVTVTVNNAAAPGYSYGYDQVGNFTGNSALGTASNVNQYSGLTYNGRGDVTDDGTYAYQYDAQDRLIVATPHDTAQPQVRYGYDSLGRRLWKTVYTYAEGTWAPSYTRHYLWDGNNLVAELDGNNHMVASYTSGPTGLLAVTDYTQTTPVTYVVAQDLSGNIDALFDPVSGNPVASFHYDPYGKLLSATGPKKDLAGFAGKGEMSDKEVRQLGFSPKPSGNGDLRVVDYVFNGFMQRDAAGEFAGGFNLHQLDGGDAVNKSDPSGQDVVRKIAMEFNGFDEPTIKAGIGISFAKGGILYDTFRITDVQDTRKYFIVTPPVVGDETFNSWQFEISQAEALARTDEVYVTGHLYVWTDDVPAIPGDRYFEAALAQQQSDVQRLAAMTEVGREVGQGVDAALHLVPGAQFFLDIPEAITGQQMSTGRGVAASDRVMFAAPWLLALVKKVAKVSKWTYVSSDTLRREAREAYSVAYPKVAQAAARMADQAGGGLLEVHHRIPLEYRALFDADPNRLSNLVGLHKDVHKEISALWDAFRRANPNPTAKDVVGYAMQIDAKYATYYNTLNTNASIPSFR